MDSLFFNSNKNKTTMNKLSIFLLFFNFVLFLGCASTSIDQIKIEETAKLKEILALKKQINLETQQLIDKNWDNIANEVLLIKSYDKREQYISNIKSYLFRKNEDGFVILENFSKNLLPNNYMKYIQLRNQSIEIENKTKQIIEQEKNKSNLNLTLYLKQTENLVYSLVNELRLQTDLSFLYLEYKIGAISKESLAKIDNCEKLYTECILSPNINIELDKLEIVDLDKILDFTSTKLPNSYILLKQIKDDMEIKYTIFNNIKDDATKLNLFSFNSSPSALVIYNFQYTKLLDCFNDFINRIRLIYNDYNLIYISDYELLKKDIVFSNELMLFTQSYSNFVEKLKFLNYQGLIIEDLISSMKRIPNRDFMISKYEITQKQWETIMGYNPSHFKGYELPVENISWDDCQIFLTTLNSMPEVMYDGITFRLPTQKEWEFACRGGSPGNYGLTKTNVKEKIISREGTIDELGWYSENSQKKTHHVGQKKPNSYGIYDMHGNVWEWTDTNSGRFKIICGGCWNSNKNFCRSYSHSIEIPSKKHSTFGLRVLLLKKEQQ